MYMRSYLLALTVLAPSLALAQHDTHQHHAAPSDPATAALLAAQIDAVRKATAKYSDIEAAKRDGYIMFGREERPLMGEHWYRRDLVQQSLDLTRPSTLQYATINGKRTLVGVAFTVYQRPSEKVPDGFAGPSDHWHVHDITKLQAAITDGRPLAAAIVRARTSRTNPAVASGRTNLAMVHAWTGLDNPDGMFAEKHRALPYLQAGLPASHASGATENAAWGVALIQKDGCEKEIRATDALARLSAQQRSVLSRSCATAQEKVVASYQRKDAAAKLNSVAELAWKDYVAERDRTLTPQQKARLASVVEHPMGG
jgi:hypothetical protein